MAACLSLFLPVPSFVVPPAGHGSIGSLQSVSSRAGIVYASNADAEYATQALLDESGTVGQAAKEPTALTDTATRPLIWQSSGMEDARNTVDSKSSTKAFMDGPGTTRDQVTRRWKVSTEQVTAPTALIDTATRRVVSGNDNARNAVDSASSTQAFFDGPGTVRHQADTQQVDEQAGQEGALPPACSPSKRPVVQVAEAPPPPSTSPSASSMTLAERLVVLERVLIGEADSPTPALKRIEQLETHLGTTSGTMIERLDALEHSAAALGLV